MKLNLISIISLLLSCVTLSQSAGSIGMPDARSAAMGRSYTAFSQGVDGIGTNPANIVNRSLTNKKWELRTVLPIPQLGFKLGTNFLTIDEYNYFFGEKSTDASGKETGRYLTTDDKQRLSELFEEGGTFQSDINYTLLAITFTPNEKVGTFAFSISDVVGSNFTFPRGIVDLLMNGNVQGDEFNINDTKLEAWWLRKYAVSYARSVKFLPKLFQQSNIGISLNFVSGFFYTGIENVNSYFTTGAQNSLTIKNNYTAYSAFSPDFGVAYDFDPKSFGKESSPGLFPASAGGGFGVDLGFWGQINDAWSFGFSLTDLGSVTWDQNVAHFKADTSIVITNISDENQTKDLAQKLSGQRDAEYLSELKTSLPSALHIGFAFQLDKVKPNFPGKLLLVADYNQGFNNRVRNSTTPRLSLGAEWIPKNWILAFRTGFSFGGFDKFGWAAGGAIDFGLVELSGGTPDFHNLFMPNGAKRISFAFDSKWKF
ncbi:MAG: hypothetical protein KF721_13155 [Ignavibacteriaceae bacterium]|nr:hypothetical protein [Ignavibacteriaceae bacterium]